MKSVTYLLFILLTVASGAFAAEATVLPQTKASPHKEITVSALLQFWVILETSENGKKQNLTDDEAADLASGFSINRARIAVAGQHGSLNGKISMGLEEGTPFLLDCYGSWSWLQGGFIFSAGQMKIPSTWEVARSSGELDFITRSNFSKESPDWATSRSVSTVSPFTSARSRLRDAGISLKGKFYGFEFNAMVGNGLGAGMYVGGGTKKQFVLANNPGAWFYALRAEWSPLLTFRFDLPAVNFLKIGGHGSYNIHPDFLYNDGNTVLDLKRHSWSVDIQLGILSRLRLNAMYGSGEVNDDFDNDGRTDFLYRGWEVRAVVVVVPRFLEAGLRYDWYNYEKTIFGGEEDIGTLTGGVTFIPSTLLRLQLNYMFRVTGGGSSRYDKDHIGILQFQARI